MPYTNPDGTAEYLIDGVTSGGFLIANSTEAITDDIYAQKLTFSGASGAVLSNCTISAGGSVVMGTKTVLSGIGQRVEVYSGGSIMLSSGAKLKNFELYDGGFVSGAGTTWVQSGIVHSGGRIRYTGELLHSVTLESGGWVSGSLGGTSGGSSGGWSLGSGVGVSSGRLLSGTDEPSWLPWSPPSGVGAGVGAGDAEGSVKGDCVSCAPSSPVGFPGSLPPWVPGSFMASPSEVSPASLPA